MLLIAKTPKLLDMSRLIEGQMEERFHLPHAPLSSYPTLNHASRYTGEDEAELFRLLVDSPTFHGVEYKGEVYVHPHSIIRFVKRKLTGLGTKARNQIKKAYEH